MLKKGVLYPVKSGSSLFAGKSKFIITIRDQETDNSKDGPNDKEATCIVKDCYCPICFKDLSRMSEIGRTQHVNHCIPEPSRTPSRSDALSKASSLLRHPDYEYLFLSFPLSPSSLSVDALHSLKKRMEDIRAKLEVFLSFSPFISS